MLTAAQLPPPMTTAAATSPRGMHRPWLRRAVAALAAMLWLGASLALPVSVAAGGLPPLHAHHAAGEAPDGGGHRHGAPDGHDHGDLCACACPCHAAGLALLLPGGAAALRLTATVPPDRPSPLPGGWALPGAPAFLRPYAQAPPPAAG